MNEVKLCIFDMDGLLLDTEKRIWFAGERKLIEEYGEKVSEELLIHIMGSNKEAQKNIMLETYGNDFPIVEYQRKLSEYYRNAVQNEEIYLMPGVKEILNFLKENNIPISLGTSTDKTLAEVALKRTGLIEYFDYAVYGDQVAHSKPDPEIYMKSVEHFNLKPEECIVFEDSSRGAEAAYNGNINLILVPDLKKPTSVDKEKALAILNSLQEAIPLIKKLNNIN